jgi:DNA-binding transcriptional ArsR family regulator
MAEDSREDEIYSIMFSSLKHPVRRKILRMLGSKPMTFMEMVDELGVSTPHLTYHLDSLGELVTKLDSGQYKLSAFGLATVNAMKGVEDIHDIEPKRRLLSFKWKAIIGVLLIAVIVLAGMTAIQFASMNQLNTSVNKLTNTNQQLTTEQSFLTSGLGENRTVNFLQNVAQVDISNYTISLGSAGDTMQTRTDFGNVVEQDIQYSLQNSAGSFLADFRFRNGHFSKYDVQLGDSMPVYTQNQPADVLQHAKNVLAAYQAYSNDSYLTNMTQLINLVNVNNTEPQVGNMKLQMSVTGSTVTFLFMYSEDGIDYQAKGLEMIFQNNVLTSMTDGYFLFTVGSTSLATSQQQAVDTAINYAETKLSWTINGQTITGFQVKDPPLSVQLTPHPRPGSVALIPYWYVELSLTQIYGGGYNTATVGIYADTGEVADVQLLTAGS